MDKFNVFVAKRKLYLALLEIPPDELTEDDLRVKKCLCVDREIQGYLRDVLKTKHK